MNQVQRNRGTQDFTVAEGHGHPLVQFMAWAGHPLVQFLAWAQSHDLQSQLSQVGQEELELLYSLKTFMQWF
jgi:hypothetical protein